MLRVDLQGFLQRADDLGLVEIDAEPYIMSQDYNVDGELENVFPGHRRFVFELPEQESYL